MKLLAITTVEQAKDVAAGVRELTTVPAIGNLPKSQAERDAPEVSAFWPELDPAIAQTMRSKGWGEQVDTARAHYTEIVAKANKGWPIPDGLKARAVFEVGQTLLSSKSETVRLQAVALLERMVRANANPNALPDQLPATGPAVAVQVNVQNNVQASAPSASVAELVDEILSRADVQAALDAEVPDPGYDYGM